MIGLTPGQELLLASLTYYDVPYVWGGTGLEGVDCSGLLDRQAQRLGIAVGRLTADDWDRRLTEDADGQQGDIAIWRHDGRAFHIGVVVVGSDDTVWVLGAHGGNSQTTTPEIARAHGAKVCIKAYPKHSITRFAKWTP